MREDSLQVPLRSASHVFYMGVEIQHGCGCTRFYISVHGAARDMHMHLYTLVPARKLMPFRTILTLSVCVWQRTGNL